MVNGKIYVIGGGVWGAGWGPGLSTVEVYDPLTNTWSRSADMPTARLRFSAGVVNGIVYAIGGITERTLFSTVEAYDTGLRQPQSVNPQGKLATTWGEKKSAR